MNQMDKNLSLCAADSLLSKSLTVSNQCVNKEISQRGSGVLQRTEIGMGRVCWAVGAVNGCEGSRGRSLEGEDNCWIRV